MSAGVPDWLPGMVAGLIAGLASGAGGVYWHVQHVDQQLVQRPPVAYINMGRAAVDAASTGQGTALLEEVRAKAGRLADAGYLVLDANTLIDAPKDLRVPLSDYGRAASKEDNESGTDDGANASSP